MIKPMPPPTDWRTRLNKPAPRIRPAPPPTTPHSRRPLPKAPSRAELINRGYLPLSEASRISNIPSRTLLNRIHRNEIKDLPDGNPGHVQIGHRHFLHRTLFRTEHPLL